MPRKYNNAKHKARLLALQSFDIAEQKLKLQQQAIKTEKQRSKLATDTNNRDSRIGERQLMRQIESKLYLLDIPAPPKFKI